MLNYTFSCYPKRFFFPPEILESQGTASSSTTTTTSTITTQADVHHQPVLDLEVKMEMYDYEDDGNGDEIQEVSKTHLLHQPSFFCPDPNLHSIQTTFKSLWEGT